jgi:hypothetical protein
MKLRNPFRRRYRLYWDEPLYFVQYRDWWNLTWEYAYDENSCYLEHKNCDVATCLARTHSKGLFNKPKSDVIMLEDI